eukprot:7723027-Lingulodinium_polyedra.AAC.1
MPTTVTLSMQPWSTSRAFPRSASPLCATPLPMASLGIGASWWPPNSGRGEGLGDRPGGRAKKATWEVITSNVTAWSSGACLLQQELD